MGFTILQPIHIVRLGLSVPNVYVSLRGSLSIHKTEPVPVPHVANLQFAPETPQYHITGRMVFYTGSAYTSLQPLHEENVSISLPTYPTSDPMTLLYEKAKSLFEGHTLIDN